MNPAKDVTGNGKLSHYDLADQLEEKGYQVRMDAENNERSEVFYDDKLVGAILGEIPATVSNLYLIHMPNGNAYWMHSCCFTVNRQDATTFDTRKQAQERLNAMESAWMCEVVKRA